MNNKAEPGLRLPASVSALGRTSHPAGRGPSLSSLFLPLAAVASAAEIEKDRHTNVYRHIPRPNRSGSHQLLTFLKIGTRALKKAPLGLSLRHFVPPCYSNPAAEIEKDRHTNVKRQSPTVDIPEDWNPRAKQQPTGLIACSAAPPSSCACQFFRSP